MPSESNGGLLSDAEKLAEKLLPFAPLLASIIPLPGSGIIAAILSSFGKTGANLSELADQVSSDSVLQEKFKEFELVHQTELQKIGLQYAQIELQRQQADNADRADARQRELKKGRDPFMSALGVSIVFGFYCMAVFVCYLAVSKEVSPNDKDIMMMIIGAALSCFTMVVTYYYGASKNDAATIEAHQTLIRSMALPNPTITPPAPVITMQEQDDPPS